MSLQNPAQEMCKCKIQGQHTFPVCKEKRRNSMRKALANASASKGGGSKMHNTMVYLRQHWQLYLIFMLPAFVLTIIFRYVPMGGIMIAFTEYNPIRGIFASEWVGFEHFERFLSSPDFMRYLMNTLKLSVYGLLWGFPAPILLASCSTVSSPRASSRRSSLCCTCPTLSPSSSSAVSYAFCFPRPA